MEQYGNISTFNLEAVLVQNIKSSHYYIKKALDLDTVLDVIDEIYETVDHVEPWLSGNARGPSSAFCLIFRLGELKPSPPEIREMLDHHDSPYIRAIGLLYLRYCCNPRDLWLWFKKYMRDDEKFTPSPANFSKIITIGTFARDILLDQYYFETIFPRIPKTVSDEVRNELRSMNLPTTALGNAGQGGPDRRGTDDGSRRPASVKASLAVALGQRAPNRAGARELGRGMGSDQQLDRDRGGGESSGGRRSRSPGRKDKYGQRGRWRRSKSRSRSRERHRYDRGSGRARSRSRDRRDISVNRGRDWDRREYGDRDNEYRRGGGGGGREGLSDQDGREFGSSYGAGGYRGASNRNYHRGGSGDRGGRSRSRSQSPRGGGSNGGGGRDVRDVFRERPAGPPGGTTNYRSSYRY